MTGVLIAPTQFEIPLTGDLVIRSLTFTAFSLKSGQLPLIYPCWTLEFEMAFYLLATLLLATVARPWLWLPCVMAALTILGRVIPTGNV
jgi:peptidoglycan/LPS O-acetylase OafA/YrhL